MTGEYETRDDRLDDPTIEKLFRIVYLWKLTGDHWKAKVKTVTLSPKPGPSAAARKPLSFEY
ncbi:MAG TPA: hypothetical protein VN903_22765 [Polyangia bacterium]|jgi:hypothetical protein|nr:hypothetical protein [Polyangia bacterium]